ncbi:dihydrofolate reductase family protein [Planotetraspora sp. GP83]|uniref:dihydrofolate reductase family protein n=1 Tax=Planotetraspora sp. GP83 TaxID=3156264 RepID=UPI0035198DA8
MGKVIFSISMSLDGFVAGPEDRPGQGLGVGGEILHYWVHGGGADGFAATGPDRAVLDELFVDTGAFVVGRRMFDVSEAWGGDPPGGLPCFVVTHHVPSEWAKPAGPFKFVTDGVESAVTLARKAAGDGNVALGGGADIGRQAIEAGVVDEIQIHLVPVLLGGGVRLFEHLEVAPIRLERTRVIESPYATHLRFTVLDRPSRP